jgi:hypothetical protein
MHFTPDLDQFTPEMRPVTEAGLCPHHRVHIMQPISTNCRPGSNLIA